MKLFCAIAAVSIFVLPLASLPAFGCPSALNVVPTADILGSNKVTIGYEIDGHQQPLDTTGRCQYLYSEFGIGGRLEVGADAYDFTKSNTLNYNAKYLLSPGDSKHPAVAVGTEYVTDDGTPAFFAVGTKTYQRFRLTAGVLTQKSDTRALLGTDFAVAPKLTGTLDTQIGSNGMSGAGLWYSLAPSTTGGVYYTYYNADQDANYVGLYVGTTFNLPH